MPGSGILSAIATISLLLILSNAEDLDKQHYSIVIDGGSSGSRIRVYKYEEEVDPKRLPNFKEVYSYKREPGVSECKDEHEIRLHILELLEKAAANVSQRYREKTPIYFMATAGMRMMMEDKANDATKTIDELLRDKSKNLFFYDTKSPDSARILSGEEEGLFAWIAANYLGNSFKKYGERKKDTVGILEMGGASTQIAWVPEGNILANKFSVRLAGVTYSLYVHSYLSYGQEQADKWIKEYLINEVKTTNLTNPCMILGTSTTSEADGVTFIGSGKPDDCEELLNKLVYKAKEDWKCSPKPCGIGTFYQPTINPNQLFYAVGAFLHGIRAVESTPDPKDGTISLADLKTKAHTFCSTPIGQLAKKKRVSEHDQKQVHLLSKQCLTALYTPILATKAFRFANDTNQIRVKIAPNTEEIEWPLGAVIYEYEKNRYEPAAIVDKCPSGASTFRSFLFPSSKSPMYLVYGLVLPLLYRIYFKI